MNYTIKNEKDVIVKDGAVELIGEGIVATAFWNDQHFVFKHKGTLHSQASKVKQPKEADPLEAKKLEIADKVTPGWRLNQMFNETFDILNGGIPEMKGMGTFIKKVIQDIKKEEQITLRESNFEIQDIQRFISNISRDYMKNKINEIALS